MEVRSYEKSCSGTFVCNETSSSCGKPCSPFSVEISDLTDTSHLHPLLTPNVPNMRVGDLQGSLRSISITGGELLC